MAAPAALLVVVCLVAAGCRLVDHWRTLRHTGGGGALLTSTSTGSEVAFLSAAQTAAAQQQQEEEEERRCASEPEPGPGAGSAGTSAESADRGECEGGVSAWWPKQANRGGDV